MAEERGDLEMVLAQLAARGQAYQVRKGALPSPSGLATGFASLDELLTIGGLPRGAISEILGRGSGGQIAVAAGAMASAQAEGGQVIGVDLGHSLDLEFLMRRGVAVEELFILQPDTLRQGLEMVDAAQCLVEVYAITGLATEMHLMALYRERLEGRGVLSSRELESVRDGRRVRVAGMVAVRQAPPTAKGFVFLTLEDEWGLMNVIVPPRLFKGQREVWAEGLVLVVTGRVERGDGQINLKAEHGERVG